MSPNCRKVRALCTHINYSIENQVVDVMAGQTESPDFLKKNPNAMVPVLEDGNFLLWESNAIMQYIAEKAKATSVWPNDLQLRADISRWQCWELAHLGPSGIWPLVWEHYFKQRMGLGAADPAAVKEGLDGFHQYAKVLDGHLAGKKYLVGNSWTLADFCVGATLSFWQLAQVPLNDYRNASAWYSSLESTDAWKKTAPPQA
jgi:glutathione S-transferase